MTANETRDYFNQYFDVTDLPETVKDERTRTCNITCIGMITGEHPDGVLQNMFDRYGKNDKFQWEEHLIQYLTDYGYNCKAVTKLAYPKPAQVTDKELEKMKKEIDAGNIILYHKKGHYQLMIGYYEKGFIFNDPAGDRKLPVYKRKRESGKGVKYPSEMVKHESIYGRCWSIKIEK